METGRPRTVGARQEVSMTHSDTELGPIDYIVVEFPPGEQRFTGAMIDAITSLVDAGTIRVLDLVVLVKDADGSVDVEEFEDLGGRGAGAGGRRVAGRGHGARQRCRGPRLGEHLGGTLRRGCA
jgi:hypothetical protein